MPLGASSRHPAVPSISTVTGDSTPQRYIYRIGVTLALMGHVPHGILLHLAYARRSLDRGVPPMYNLWRTAMYFGESVSLMVAGYVSTKENFSLHQYGFAGLAIFQALHQ